MKGGVLLVYLCFIVSSVWSSKVYFTDGKNALEYEVDDAKRTTRSCRNVPASDVEEEREIQDDEVVINDVTSENLALIARDCLAHADDQNVRDKRSFFIYKGTKWCGIGSNAVNDNDLGVKRVTDACCRTHDKCKPYLKAWACMGSFCNKWPWSRFECSCDDALYSCLKAAARTNERSTANAVGKLYFDLLGTKCYKKGSYRKCSKRGWLWRCKQYKTVYGLHWTAQKKSFG